MVFLHPSQRSIIERRLDGPGRVRGGAGTGKTVVALHRAAALARRYETGKSAAKPILFTTFVRSLVPVMERLYLRLPGTGPGEVTFTNVDKLALPLFYRGGGKGKLDPAAVDAAFASAWRQAVGKGSAIAASGLSRDYMREEIRTVIKGRALRTVDEYLGVQRTGRQTRFPEALRREVWALRLAWDGEIAKRGAVDFPDVILGALEASQQLPEPSYQAAIIDEAQDLSLAALLLVRSLVNGPEGVDRPDGLLIVGDGAQRVYPGVYSLRQAGVEVRGRTSVLRQNYRNSAEIIRAAVLAAGSDEVDDIDETLRRGDAVDLPARTGPLPIVVSCPSRDAEHEHLCSQLHALIASEEVGAGDIGVFARTNKAVEELLTMLHLADIPSLRLDRYTGETTAEVKVGTYFRAKGLEFKVVYLPGLEDGAWPRPRQPGQDDAAYDEQRRLDLSQLFVALTRARDQLIITCTGTPAAPILEAIDAFEVRSL